MKYELEIATWNTPVCALGAKGYKEIRLITDAAGKALKEAGYEGLQVWWHEIPEEMVDQLTTDGAFPLERYRFELPPREYVLIGALKMKLKNLRKTVSDAILYLTKEDEYESYEEAWNTVRERISEDLEYIKALIEDNGIKRGDIEKDM